MNLELKKFDMKNISFKPNEASGPVIVLIEDVIQVKVS